MFGLYFILFSLWAWQKEKCFVLVKKTDMEWRAIMNFFLLKYQKWRRPLLKTPKMKEITLKNSKKKGTSANFYYKNRKNKSTPLCFSSPHFLSSVELKTSFIYKWACIYLCFRLLSIMFQSIILHITIRIVLKTNQQYIKLWNR